MYEVSRKIKVGLGPKTSWNSFHQSGEKVATLLSEDPRFACGFFSRDPFSLDELSRFDVLIFIKQYPSFAMLRELKARGKILIFDVQDRALWQSMYEQNPVRKFLKKIYYYTSDREAQRQLRAFDLCFVASPGYQRVLDGIGARAHFLQRQLYNDKNEFDYKSSSLKKDSLMVYWTGVGVNQKQNIPILPTLKRLHDTYHCRIVYSSDTDPHIDFVEYRKWSRDRWEKELLEADIAFRWHDISVAQSLKDANKIMSGVRNVGL